MGGGMKGFWLITSPAPMAIRNTEKTRKARRGCTSAAFTMTMRHPVFWPVIFKAHCAAQAMSGFYLCHLLPLFPKHVVKSVIAQVMSKNLLDPVS